MTPSWCPRSCAGGTMTPQQGRSGGITPNPPPGQSLTSERKLRPQVILYQRLSTNQERLPSGIWLAGRHLHSQLSVQTYLEAMDPVDSATTFQQQSAMRSWEVRW